jgi:hypothetical protein
MAKEDAVVDDVARTERLLAAYGERAASDRRAARIGVGAEQCESEHALLDECAGARDVRLLVLGRADVVVRPDDDPKSTETHSGI